MHNNTHRIELIRNRLQHIVEKHSLPLGSSATVQQIVQDRFPHLNTPDAPSQPHQESDIGLNRYIDHTVLKANAREDDIRKLCEEAMQYKFAAVCVNSCRIPLVKSLLSGVDNDNAQQSTGIASVVGFPLGAMSTSGKLAEAKDALDNGATELDMVINVCTRFAVSNKESYWQRKGRSC